MDFAWYHCLRAMASFSSPSSSWSWLPRRFAPTRWSLVRRLSGAANDRRLAADEFCRIYWFPLYAYLRQRGYSAEAAQDHVQSFMVRVLEKNWLEPAKECRGRLRGYLVKLLDRHVAGDAARSRAQKRGGGVTMISFETAHAEQWLTDSGRTDALSPEDVLCRALACRLIDEGLVALRRYYAERHRSELLEELLPALEGPLKDETYADVAVRVGMTAGAVKAEATRMRNRYSKALMVAASLALQLPPGPALEAELRQLFDLEEPAADRAAGDGW